MARVEIRAAVARTACVQFVGSRGFTFRARAGSLPRQLRLFIAAEIITLGLNWGAFQVLIRRLPETPPELVSFLGTGLVFVAFAYPVRRSVIFRLPSAGEMRDR